MKYFIYSNPRCASTMLQRSLGIDGEIFGRNAMPRLKWRDDLFNRLYDSKFDEMLVKEKGSWVIDKKYDLRLMLDFIDSFKLIHFQVSNDNVLYDSLVERNYKCISLKRNLWHSCVSFKLSKLSDVWHPEKEYKKDRPIIFPIEEIQWFLDLYSHKEIIEKKFSDVLELHYDDVDSNWDCVSKKISEYLDIKPPKKLLCKRTTRNLESIILNYKEIYDYFKHTKYKKLFESSISIL